MEKEEFIICVDTCSPVAACYGSFVGKGYYFSHSYKTVEKLDQRFLEEDIYAGYGLSYKPVEHYKI